VVTFFRPARAAPVRWLSAFSMVAALVADLLYPAADGDVF